MVAVDGGWLQGEKFSEFFFVPYELKSPKNNMSFFVFIHILGVGGSEANVDKSTFFNPSLSSTIQRAPLHCAAVW